MSKESSSIYRLEHLDKFREYQKRYIEKKKQDENYLEKSKEYQKEYHKKYREKLKINNKVLTELEEWLKTVVEYETLHKSGYMTVRGEWGEEVLEKIQELKEKYK